ncbi:3-ketoacyl-ACP reductase [Planctomicrobium sp. SH664]|uniref:3-ketoacyl-ACP reductase n=1 Tax=Planctomicrobium sp. SH664 TaxID=3448125 RepID=UPI003F5C949C
MKVALITGSARGIGLGIASELARAGWSLMLNGVRPVEAVQTSLEEIRSLGADVDYCAADIGQAEDRQRLIAAVVSRFGRIDSLVNNAGITSPGRKDLLEAEEAGFDQVMAINLKGPYFLTQLAARQMVSQDRGQAEVRGSVVFVSSVSAEIPSTNRGDYCLTKSAIRMATQLWAARLAEYGIDVYEVRPGIIRSDMTAGVTEKYDKLIAGGLTLEPRWGEPADVGKAVRVLVEGDLPYATGQLLKVDGGMTIRTL